MIPLDLNALSHVFLIVGSFYCWNHANTPPSHESQTQPGDVATEEKGRWILIHALTILKILLSINTALEVLLCFAPTVFVGTPLNTYFPSDYTPHTTLPELLGAILALTGCLIRIQVMKTLGNFFTWQIKIRPGHRLIKTGMYRYVRHPAYTGLLLACVGMGLAQGSGALMREGDVGWIGWMAWWTVWAGVPAWLVGLRIATEEEVLRKRFGKEWKEYRKGTWALVPGVY